MLELSRLPVVQRGAVVALHGLDRWHLCVLIGGNDLRTYEIPRDRELEAAILAGAREFWSHVEQCRPPDPATPEDVRLRWPKDLGTSAIATPEIAELCAELGLAKSDLKAAATREESLKADVCKFMQEAAQLVDADGTLLATWRTAKASEKFDLKRFEQENPDLYRQYLRDVPGSRRFLLK